MPLTDTQKLIVKQRYANMPSKQLADELGVSIRAINDYAYAARLHKSKEYMLEFGGLFRRGIKPTNAFKPGNIPHNKGKKQPESMLKRMRPTMFKKGNKPYNTREDGCITYRKTKRKVSYFWVRVSESNWVPLHRHVWEHHNGTVPHGHVVRFKDGNQYNCDITNLECITMKENRYRNNFYNMLPPELIEIKRMQIVIKSMITKQRKKQEQ